jgi:7,8-dihydropterin-6-yl-methyl-4-(beta-D-ribofuranosyl)aminobenzene 5'-phosphate synthase
MAVSRRLFIGSAAVGVLGSRSAAAASSKLLVPQVDSVTLQVVVDNATFGPFLPDETLPGLKIQRANPDAGKATMTRSPLRGEFGLSVLSESKQGEQTRRVLVDFGYSAEVLSHNIALLGIDAQQIDATVLSHGHLDHYGGFAGLLQSRQISPGQGVPLYIGGEEAFCERLALIGLPPPLMGTLDRAGLAKAGFDVRMASEPRVIADHAFTTGVIPLQSFERAAIPTQMRPGAGCDADKLGDLKRKAKQLADDGEHELATAYHVKGMGLVVVASCSHRGVLNSIRRAQEISGVEKVLAIVGGFHLVRPRTEDEAKRTVAEMMRIDPTYVVPMHCTGDVFVAEAMRLMPQKLVRSYVGTRLTFGPT